MKKRHWFFAYIAVYLLINLLFLEQFPFVHSDEAWLSGLSRNILERGDFSVTETFFDLKPRYPHAVKLVFHALQIGMTGLFGYRLFTFRLLSMLFALGCLLVFRSLAARLSKSEVLGSWAAVFLSLDIQFLYAAHFARPEIMVLFLLLLTVWLLTGQGRRRFWLAGLATGLCIGVHPNSFIVGCAGAGVIAALWIAQGRADWRGLFQYAGPVAAFAALFVALSFSFDPAFPAHYLAFGSEFEIDASLGAKLSELLPYFQRLFYRVSGTYYTPDIRPQLIASALVFLLGLAACVRSREARALVPMGALLGLLAGFVLIGRFNQPYVVFFFPLVLLTALALPWRPGKRTGLALLLSLTLALGAFSGVQIAPWLRAGRYGDYLQNISALVPPDARVIGNLNADYAFENGCLLDYRNLSFLSDAGLSFEDYVDSRGVEYLIVSDELALIYSLRPRWNGIYGNIDYLNALEAFVETRCRLVGAFTDNLYGVRIVRFLGGGQDFGLRVYEVLPKAGAQARSASSAS